MRSRSIILVLVVIIMFILSGCTSTDRIEVQTKIITSPPVFLDKPSIPYLSRNPILTITPEVAQGYSDACNDFRDGTALPEEYVGLAERTACNYALQCFTHTGWSNEEQDQILIQNYVERLEEQRDFYEKQLKDRYERTIKE